MMNIEIVRDYLASNKIAHEEGFSLAKASYLKIGGKVPVLITPENLEAFIQVVRYLVKSHVEYKVLGNLSNCLFSDREINKVIVSTKRVNVCEFHESTVTAQTGLMLPLFVNTLVKKQITGFEGLIGIPGTIGGAIYSNAGAYGSSISDHLIGVTCLTKSGNIEDVTKDLARFSFRKSVFQGNDEYIILAAKFQLVEGVKSEIESKVRKCQLHRIKYQETELPNLGSLFKTTNIYKEIAKTHAVYGFFVSVIMKIGRLLGRYQPDILLNLTVKYFNLRYDGEKPYSGKTLNCLVNRGSMTFEKAISYIDAIKKLFRGSVELEIDIIE